MKRFYKEPIKSKEGMSITFRRLLGDTKKIKGIVDTLVIDDNLEISKLDDEIMIRGKGMNGHIQVMPYACNVIHIKTARF